MIRIRVCEVCGKEFAVENRSRKSICSYECRRRRANEIRREIRASERRFYLPEEKPVEEPSVSLNEMARLAKETGLSYGYYEALKGKKS